MDDGYVPGGRWSGGGAVGGEDEDDDAEDIEPLIEMVARASLLPSFPVMRLYRSTDPNEMALLRLSLKKAEERATDLRRDLARRIVNEYASRQPRSKKKG